MHTLQRIYCEQTDAENKWKDFDFGNGYFDNDYSQNDS